MSDPSTGLPALDDETLALLQRVQDSGGAPLVELDEAELVAATGLPPSSGRGPAAAPPETLDAAGRRLVERGLAEPVPWALAAYRPLGPLLTFAQLATHPRAHIGMVSSWDEPYGPDSVQIIRRVTVLTDIVRAGQACVELVHKPLSDAPPALPVTISLARLDTLVDEVVADAVPTRGGGRETLVLFADGRGRQDPSRYRVGADGRGELESSRQGLLGAKTVRDRADAAAFADHVRLRLMAAG